MGIVRGRMAYVEFESVVTSVGVMTVVCLFPFAWMCKEIAAGRVDSSEVYYSY